MSEFADDPNIKPGDIGPAGQPATRTPVGEGRAAGRSPRLSDFSRLWVGQGVSSLGSQVTTLAVPLTAVLYLHVTAFQMGLLAALREVGFLAPMLVLGAMVDQMRRRPLMIGADLGRTVLIALIPLLAWVGVLDMPVLYLVGIAAGSLASVFILAYQAYLPSLVDQEALLSSNSKLQATSSVSDVAGPGLAGVLVQIMGAPYALLVDAGTFLFSAVMVSAIRKPEPAAGRRETQAHWLRAIFDDIWSGLSFTFRHSILRPLAVADAAFNFFATLMLTLFVLYAVRSAHLSASQIGIVFAAFGIGGVIASAAVGRVAAKIGYGWLLLTGYLVGGLSILSIPFVAGTPLLRTVLYGIVFFIAGCGIIALNIAEMTMKQVVTPNSAQGRVSAGFGFIIGALVPFSALLAGILGASIGLRVTLFIAGAGALSSVLWLAPSPVRRMRSLDDLKQKYNNPQPELG